MTATFTSFENGAEIFKALDDLPAKIQKKGLLGIMYKAAKIWETEARRRAPVNTGRLRNTIKVYRGRIRDSFVGAAVIVRPDTGLSSAERKQVAIQSIAQEFGWMYRPKGIKRKHKKNELSNLQRDYPGHPYLRGAFESKRKEVEDYVETELWKLVSAEWEGRA